MNKLFILILILIIIFSIIIVLNFNNNFEGFSNYQLNQSIGNIPESQNQVLVENIYPPIKNNGISNNNSSDIWRDYPIFELGSYEQITNNIKYPNNPDEGTCMPASMCGALYNKKELGSNIIDPLPPINPECDNGKRVGYFSTNIQLIDSLPYRTNMSNILY